MLSPFTSRNTVSSVRASSNCRCERVRRPLDIQGVELPLRTVGNRLKAAYPLDGTQNSSHIARGFSKADHEAVRLLQLAQFCVYADPSLHHDDDALTNGFHFLQYVSRDNDGRMLAQPLHERAHFENLSGVQAIGGFVEDQDFRLVQDRLRNAKPLLIPLNPLESVWTRSSARSSSFVCPSACLIAA